MDKCDKCGHKTTKKQFRTGDVQRPGGEVDACPNCGKQCPCDKKHDETDTNNGN